MQDDNHLDHLDPLIPTVFKIKSFSSVNELKLK